MSSDNTYLVVARDDYMEKKRAVRVDAANPEMAVESKGMAGYDQLRVYRIATDEDGLAAVYTKRDMDL